MQNQLKSLESSLEVLNSELINLQSDLEGKTKNRDNIEVNPDEFEDHFCEILDDLEGEFMGMSASYILKECDPTAFRCGLIDYCDCVDVEQLPEYQEAQEEIEEVESQIEDLELTIEELEEEISELENEES